MFVTHRPILPLALVLIAASWSASLAAQCLYYGDVSLSGRLVQQTYPGPPDFESVAKGDAPLVIWILQLEIGACIISNSASYPSVYDEHEIQLVIGNDQYARTGAYAGYRSLIGKKISVTGTLLPGRGKYQKPQVITLRSIKELS